MRLILLFVIIACLVGAFMVADRFPQMLEDHPQLQRINLRVRDLLGLEVESPAFLSDSEMEVSDKILEEVSKQDKGVAACGEPPENPWSRDYPPSQADIDRYRLQVGLWEYCVQQGKGQAGADEPRPGRKKASKHKLAEYPE
jgi:hypothetical protein